MVALSSLVGGTGGGGVCPSYFFKTGCSGWTPPKDGCAVIHIIGAGAGTSASAAGGGGAGGYIRYAAEFTTSDSPYCIIVGAGGHYTGGCSMMCGGSPAWCMIAYGGCCNIGGNVSFSTCPNATNMTFSCGGCGAASGGSVGLFATPGGSGYNGSSSSGDGYAGGAGVGGLGGVGRGSCCCRMVIGAGGGSGGQAAQSLTFFDAYGTERVSWSMPGPALIKTPEPHSKYFKFVPEWGTGGYAAGTSSNEAGCCGKFAHVGVPGWGGGGHGGTCDRPAQHGGPFSGGGFGPGGSYGGYPGGGGGGGINCSARCYCVCGGSGAVIVEYIEV